MPNYKTHLVGGVITFILVLFVASNFCNIMNFTPHECLLYFGAACFGALFPDIDTRSMIQRCLLFLILILCFCAFIWRWWALLVGVLFLLLWLTIVKHRTTTHRKRFICLLPLGVIVFVGIKQPELLPQALTTYAFFVAGALSHIFLDFGFCRRK
jgi:hypothetical protein